jgi:hypothetical protein
MSSEQNPITNAEITQVQLDTLMGIFEDYKGNLAEGDYLPRTVFRRRRRLCASELQSTSFLKILFSAYFSGSHICK